MEEMLNEKGEDGKGLVVRGKHYLLLEDMDTAKKQMRILSRRLILKPVLIYKNHRRSEPIKQLDYNLEFKGINTNFSKHIHILAIEPFEGSDTILLRLENLCEEDDQKVCSTVIELEDLFTTIKVISCFETDLSGDENLEHIKKNRLIWSYINDKEGGLKKDQTGISVLFNLRKLNFELSTKLLIGTNSS